MKFKTKPGKKGRSKYLPKKTSKPKARKNPMTIKGYQAKEKQYNKITSKRASTLIQAARLYGQREKLSREMEAWRNWRIPEIQREMEKLENKDRSRRRGANKNQWTEVDLQKYAKLKQELEELQPTKRDEYFEADFNNAERWALLKKYHDYVDRGIIKKNSVLDSYSDNPGVWGVEEELAKFHDSLPIQELQAVVKDADEKWNKLAKESMERAARFNF